MKLIITKKDLNENNEYIGPIRLFNYDCSVVIEENLGMVKFDIIKISDSITAKKGSGITTLNNIESNKSIISDLNIRSLGNIKAGWDIRSNYNIYSSGCIEATGNIRAGGNIIGWGIRSDGNICAEGSIKSDGEIETKFGFIKSGENIKAKWDIQSGQDIYCKKILSVKHRIFAGLYLFQSSKKRIVCGTLESGEICYGNLIEFDKLNDLPTFAQF